jgi:oligopeptide transport system permease protein
MSEPEKTVQDNIDPSLFTFAEYSHERAERITYSNYSYWKSTLNTFLRRKLAVVLLVIIVILAFFACIQPLLPNQFTTDKTPYPSDVSMWNHPPNATHWFGTDSIGKDMWSLTWFGTRISLALSLIVAVFETLVGVVVGALWGYVRRLDRPMTELYNIIANVPSIVLYTLIAYLMQPGFWTIVFAMVCINWIYMARYVRNMVLIIRDREYNLASRTLGTPTLRMLLRNIVPHLTSVIIMTLALDIPAVISLEIILTYLGVGLPTTTPSLGVLVSHGQSVFSIYPHLLVFPVLIVSIITVSFYVVGNSFSDASDPRNHI